MVLKRHKGMVLFDEAFINYWRQQGAVREPRPRAEWQSSDDMMGRSALLRAEQRVRD